MKTKSTQEPITKHPTLNHMKDGCVSGFLSGLFLQPFQVIKTAMQVNPVARDIKTKTE